MTAKPFRRGLRKLLILALAAGLLPTLAAAQGTAACLALTGTSKDADTVVRIGTPFALEYTVNQTGELPPLVTSREPADIAFVLDVSGSMSYPMTSARNSPTRLATLKSAAKSLIGDLQAQGVGDRVGIVKFSDLASTELSLTSDYTKVRSKIDGLTDGGGTNIEDGLQRAADVLSASVAGGRKSYVILVTDGYATTYRDGNKGKENRAKARSLALDRADRLASLGIKAYAIALGTPGSSDVDHELLTDIAARTHALKYAASDADELSEVFANIKTQIDRQGVVTGIAIRQPVPAGFELTKNNPAGATIGGGVLTVPLADIAYRKGEPQTRVVRVELQSSVSGIFEMDDATLDYVDACGARQSANIPNGNVVAVGWIDRWGNLYAAGTDGDLSRYRHGNLGEKQFTVKGHGSPAVSVTFEGADDALVRIGYKDGTSAPTLNLRPAAPTIRLEDANGREIGAAPAGQAQAALRLSGSGPQLPAGMISFDGANRDFQADYLAGFQYQVNGGPWKDAAAAGNALSLSGATGVDVKARAVTTAVSGKTEYPSYGDEAGRKLTFGWKDRWNNLYLANENGDVSRYRQSDPARLQFTVPGHGAAVSDVTFTGSDDAAVKVTYRDGTVSDWDLRPQTPDAEIKDAKGAPIAATETGWRLGKASVRLSGGDAVRYLPPNTIYEGDDFTTGYFRGYESRTAASAWAAAGVGPVPIDRLGAAVLYQARSVTGAVSGTGALSYSDAFAQTLSLDDSAPQAEASVVWDERPDNDPLLIVKAADVESGIQYVEITAEIALNGVSKTKVKTIKAIDRTAWEVPLSDPDLFPNAADRKGWVRVRVKTENNAGLKAGAEEVFAVNPGPTGSVATKDGKSYASKASAKPVTVVVTADAVIVGEAAGFEGSYDIKLKDAKFRIDTTGKDGTARSTGFIPLGAKQFQLTGEGTNQVTVVLTDTEGKTTELKLTVKIDYDQNRY